MDSSVCHPDVAEGPGVTLEEPEGGRGRGEEVGPVA